MSVPPVGPGAGLEARSPLLHMADGVVLALPLDRWLARPDAAEEPVLDRAAGPVLDIGCGPGRHTAELAARGVPVLGIDTAPAAVATARRRGCPVLRRSVFERLPGEGGWRTALLIDGNIGIGGHPRALLRRVCALLAGGGHALVEVEAPGEATVATRARIEHGGELGPWFAWARVGLDGIEALAGEVGLRLTWAQQEQGRWFVQLTS